jgi:UDP-N-acetylglucosamine acyltransferase
MSPASVHPTAIVGPEVELADGVEVGPFAVLEGPVKLGPGCVIRPHAHLIGPITLGPDNHVGTGAVLGERPQSIAYRGEPTETIIGAGNTFREYVTVHRGTPGGGGKTVIGDLNFLMAHAHIAHDCQVGSHVVIANNTLLAGHVVVGDRAFLSGNAAVQQFCRIGRLAMLSGLSSSSKDIPPFLITAGRNCLAGVNVVGMRRAGVPTPQITAVRHAYRILCLQGLALAVALDRVERELSEAETVRELVSFIRQSPRGICPPRVRPGDLNEAA